ncbi:MAG: outer membrane beta-barrel protein [Bacteroidia bacterium]
MKKIKSLLVAAVLVATGIFAPNASAQKYQGQMNITAGGAFSLTGLVGTAVTSAVNTANGRASATPGLAGMFDYGVSDRFSIGAAYNFQQFTVKFSSYVNDNGNTVNGDFKYSVTRQNIGLRALFHFGDNDDLDTYAGARFGYTLWNTNTNAPGLSLGDEKFFRSRLWPQALFGMRYYFTENIGVNAEFAIGPPYYMMFGLNFRFGGN